MDAYPILARIAELLDRHRLDAVMVGNAAAALPGAPVTTVDFDFFFRRTPANVRKLRDIASELEAVLMKPYYPVSGMLRISRDEDGLQLDFMGEIHGVRSFEGLRKRAIRVRLGDRELVVAALADIIKSKKAADRPRDRAVLPILEKALEEASSNPQDSTGRLAERE